jgi:hypothetical protein
VRATRRRDTSATETVCVVAIEPAGEHRFQKQPVLVEAAGRKLEPAIGKGAVAPDVTAGKEEDARVVFFVGTRGTNRHLEARLPRRPLLPRLLYFVVFLFITDVEP